MPVIAQTQNVSRPFFTVPSQAPLATSPETVTVTAPRDANDDTGKSFFDDLLDVVNPLEHLPIVSTIYSNLTGDKPNDFTQVAGDTLYGGPLGLLSSIGNLAFKDVTGKSIGDTIWGWVTGSGSTSSSATAKPSTHDEVRKPLKPSTDLFSFLRSNVGSDSDSKQVAATTAQTPSTPAATQSASTSAAMQPRLLNPLPARGAVSMHTEPSENVRAAGMAAMIANRAHLRTPASEGNAPAIRPAAPIQNPAQPVAANKPATVSVGADGIPQLDGSGEQALVAALNKNGISGAIGQQALMAYHKTMAMSPDANNAAALAAVTTLH